MPQKVTATVERTGKSGRFTVRKSDGEISAHKVSEKSSRTIKKNVTTYRDALKRLADR